ncbi:MAG: sodium:proton exchanger [Vulcanisaeta sp. JCHS_4]|jgi:Ca2+/Na+ antiporter|nr:MAG: sodium:proton exchanger [Vulcanisaeta sp. JCHS_4]
MLSIILSIAGGFTAVLIGGWLFTNSMEHISHRYRLGGSFVGAVISPVLTSLPELIVFLVALLVYGGVSGEEVAVGTVIGEPFVVSTIIYPIIFLVAIIGFRRGSRNDLVLEVGRELILPFIVVITLYPTVLLPALLGIGVIRYVIATALFIAYLVYVGLMRGKEGVVIEDVEELRFIKLARFNENVALALQVITSVLLLYVGSKYLVSGVVDLSRMLSIDTMGLSIIIVPTATVLPESITAIIWTLGNRDTMAVAALIGEKVLYSTIYPALALVLTSWSLTYEAIISVITVEAVSVAMLYHVLRGRLTWDVGLIGLVGYAIYIIALI